VTAVPAVELYAGPGGWSLAAARLGIDAVGIELDRDACATATAAGLPRVHADVTTLRPRDYAGATGLIASPPCPGFSRGGLRAGLSDLPLLLTACAAGADARSLAAVRAGQADHRSALALEPLRWIRHLRPEWVVLEQVPDVLPLWEGYATRLRATGYSVATGVLAAEAYGVPQTRLRAVLVASRTRPVALPAPTHSRYAPWRLQDGLKPWVSAAEAIGWHPDTYAGFPRRMRLGKDGTMKDAVRLGAVNYRARDLFRAGSRPARAVTGKVCNWKVWEPGADRRHITPTEAAQLQTFPADYPWTGGASSVGQQIGNAVPPLLAGAVLAEVTGARP
jgi:DNA (cytosine-5)-methyltransferase 1